MLPVIPVGRRAASRIRIPSSRQWTLWIQLRRLAVRLVARSVPCEHLQGDLRFAIGSSRWINLVRQRRAGATTAG